MSFFLAYPSDDKVYDLAKSDRNKIELLGILNLQLDLICLYLGIRLGAKV